LLAPLLSRCAVLLSFPAFPTRRSSDLPLYSMVPKGLTGHTTGFFDDYGEPSVAKAKEILTDAGITQKVPLTLWYTTDRYGSATAAEFKELERQLEASKLFDITLKSRPRSEEHTSELQSRENLVCRLLLE